MEEVIEKIEVRDIRDSDWYWISRTVLEDFAFKIGVTGLALYNAYASFAREKGKAFPSQKKLVKLLRISVPTLIKYNKILEANNLIRIEKRKGKTSIVYLLKPFKKGSKTALEGVVKEFKTKENNMKENKNKEKEIDGSLISEVFRYFKEAVGEAKGFVPEFDWEKDGKLVKARLKNHSLEEVKALIDWYLKSEVSNKIGVSLSACLSAHVINLWKANRNQSVALKKLYPTWHLKE